MANRIPSNGCSTLSLMPEVAAIDPDANAASSVLTEVEGMRRDASAALARDRRVVLGQFLPPSPLAQFMASIARRRTSIDSRLSTVRR